MPPRLATPLAIALLTALVAGCGSTSIEIDESRTGTVEGKVEIGEVQYEAEPVPDAGAPAGAAATSCETQAVDAESLRATGVPCEQARQLMFGWQRASACGPGGARGACSVRSYRCVATRAERGVAVSCARPGQSVAFLATRR